MTNPDDPAFPKTNAAASLTKREYFASAALMMLRISDSRPEIVAEWATQYADALIAQLNKPK